LMAISQIARGYGYHRTYWKNRTYCRIIFSTPAKCFDVVTRLQVRNTVIPFLFVMLRPDNFSSLTLCRCNGAALPSSYFSHHLFRGHPTYHS
jgi:hypothetical protein